MTFSALEVRQLLRLLGEELGLGTALERRAVVKEPRLRDLPPTPPEEELHDQHAHELRLRGGARPSVRDTLPSPGPADDDTDPAA